MIMPLRTTLITLCVIAISIGVPLRARRRNPQPTTITPSPQPPSWIAKAPGPFHLKMEWLFTPFTCKDQPVFTQGLLHINFFGP